MKVNEKYPYFLNRLIISVQNYIGISIALFIIFLLIRVIEFALIYFNNAELLEVNLSTFQFIRFDSLFFFNIHIYTAVPFILLGVFLDFRVINFFMHLFIAITGIIYLMLVFYFSQALAPLGSEFLNYSNEDIRQTVGSSGVLSVTNIIAVILLFVFFIYLSTRFTSKEWSSYILIAFFLLMITAPFLKKYMEPNSKSYVKVIQYQIVLNKLQYFAKSLNEKIGKSNSIAFDGFYYDDDYSNSSEKYIDPENYPFLHKDSTANVLGAYFNQSNTPPNFVFIIVEGLGRSYSGKDAELGSFTPFLDSLSNHSLYWENFLSNGGRTFAVLPSVFGSLPFAPDGFLELGEAMPKHQSLINLMSKNNYQTNFYHGGDASFDNMIYFLKSQNVNQIVDVNSMPKNYKKMPPKIYKGFSWGYGDREVFQHYLKSSKSTKPRLDIILTLSTHSPFKILNQEKYYNMFENHLNTLAIEGEGRQTYSTYKDMYSCILYTDDAIRYLINEYKKRADFNNTIFIITGDHRMPEIPLNSNLDRFYVPLIVYSPMLKRTASFKGVSSHLDITPTLLAYLRINYNFKKPSVQSWVGSNLDTSRYFNSVKFIPLKRNKTEFVDYIDRGIFSSKGEFFRVNDILRLSTSDDKITERMAGAKFKEFNSKSEKTFTLNRIIPDSVYSFMPK